MPTTQYMTSAPSSPKPFFGDPLDDYYFCNHASAPSSPTRAAAIYAHFSTTTASSPAPFSWGDKLGGHTDPFDFAFDFSGHGAKGVPPPALATADQLFEAGKIRPMKPPAPTLHPLHDDRRSVQGCGKGEKFDSLLVEMEETTRGRGRERDLSTPSVSSTMRWARSLSPFRREGVFLKTPNSSSPSTTTSSSSTSVVCGGSRRWKLRDLLLFRNGSEGRVIGRGSKDPLRKFTLLSPSLDKISRGEDSKSSSFGSARSNGSMEWGSKGGGQVVSAHEIHYMENRSASEEQKKKTPLPYHRHGLFGYLRFNPAIRCITRGFNGNSIGRRGRS